jgi:E3 ubiquitin-protein ligase UBR1
MVLVFVIRYDSVCRKYVYLLSLLLNFILVHQAHHYRDVSLRENTFDTDLYLLQFGFVLVNPDHLFTTILDRFGLLAWFSGKPNQPPYDTSQANYMVEEMLSLLIVFGSERAHAAHLSLEDKIRREIIQNLCISPMAHSELGKKITESMSEDAKFDHILSDVAKFKAPDGLNDHGVYELKPEYYNNIDPHFWHYTRNNREDVEAALQKIWKKERESQGLDANPQDFFIIPKLARITSGPFTCMGNMLHSRVLLQIIFYALWNCKNSSAPTSDTITEQALYLAMMAIVDENNDYTEETYNRHTWDKEANGVPGFIWYAATDSFPVMVNELEREHISLLRLLLRIIEDSQMANLHKRCLWIADNIEARGNKEAKDHIRIWREERRVLHTQQLEGAHGQHNLSESERKKLAAKERQAKIMAQFAQAQSAFMSQNEDIYDGEDTDTDMEVEEEDRPGTVSHDGIEVSDDGELEVQRKFHFPTGTCIVCQEEADTSQLYGMLAFIQPSTLLRQTPLDDADVIADVFNMKQGLDVELPQEEPMTSEKSSSSKKQPRASNVHGFPPQSHKSGLHMSTCSHLMHVKCFETYYASIESRHAAQSRYKHPENLERLEYLCPLCKALGNTLLPIVWKGKTESYPGVLAGANDQLYETFMTQGIDELLVQIEKRRQFEPSKFLKDRFWMTMTSDLSSRLPWSGRLSGRTTGVDESVLEAMNVTVDPTDMILVKKMYSRLAMVLEAIVKGINSETSVLVDTKLLESMDLLWGLYGYTISSIEIAQRGRSNQASSDLTVEHTGTLIDSISEQTRTLLRIFSETVMLYKHVFHEDQEIDSQEKEASVNVARVAQLFYSNKAVRTMLEADRKATVVFENLKPLLEDEPFLVLVELSMSMVPNLELNIHHFVRQLFTAEIVKAAVALLQGLTGNEKLAGDRARKHLEAYRQHNDAVDKETVRAFTYIIMDILSVPRDFVDRFFQTVSEAAFISLLRSFALPYLRRCMILLVVRHGLIIQPLEDSGEETPEFDRLLKCLRLPTLDQIMKEIIRQPATVTGWCQHYIDYSRKTSTSLIRTNAPAYTQLLRISIGLPTVFHLVDLPNRLDQLFEESMHKACRKCGNVPNDPALCLLCGTFVCLQGYCCMEGEQGECNMHTAM